MKKLDFKSAIVALAMICFASFSVSCSDSDKDNTGDSGDKKTQLGLTDKRLPAIVNGYIVSSSNGIVRPDSHTHKVYYTYDKQNRMTHVLEDFTVDKYNQGKQKSEHTFTYDGDKLTATKHVSSFYGGNTSTVETAFTYEGNTIYAKAKVNGKESTDFKNWKIIINDDQTLKEYDNSRYVLVYEYDADKSISVIRHKESGAISRKYINSSHRYAPFHDCETPRWIFTYLSYLHNDTFWVDDFEFASHVIEQHHDGNGVRIDHFASLFEEECKYPIRVDGMTKDMQSSHYETFTYQAIN